MFAAAFALLGARQAAAAVPFAPCGEPDGIVCGAVTVPLDRSGSVPGTVNLFLQKKPTAAAPSQGAVFLLEGGPGFSATAVTEGYVARLAPALQTRDLIVMDYRGVGLSDPLSCMADWQTQRQQCALELGPRVHFYSTREIVEDIEAVRQQLGVDKIAVYGVSYGTFIAQAYARRYGNHIEFLVLDSVLPPDGWDPIDGLVFHAIPRVLRDLCTGGQCRGITTDPVRDLTTLLGRIGTGSTASYVDVNGRPASGTYSAIDLFDVYYGNAPMFQSSTRARFPSAVASALRGDTFPLGRLLLQNAYENSAQAGMEATHGPTTWNPVAYYATKCEDALVPWRGETTRAGKLAKVDAAVSALPASLFAPFPRTVAASTPDITSCLDWIVADKPPVTQPLVPYTGRALLINGENDLRTPLEGAQAAAAQLPGSVLLTVHAYGHNPGAGSHCAITALADFVAGRTVQQCVPAVSPTAPEPIAPTSLAKLKPWPGVPGTVGKTIRAVIAAVRDVGYTAYTNGPFVGLRSGTFSRKSSLTNHISTMHSIQYVPGVLVSGTFDDATLVAKVTVTGTGSRGSLTITAKAITGKLGGKKIRAAGASLAIRGPDNR